MTRVPFLRPLSALGAAALVIGACGGSTPSATPVPATQAPSVAAPSVVAPTAPAFSGLPGFSFELPSVDKDLEGLLPDDIAGETVLKSSVTGTTLLTGQGSEDFQAVLSALNKTPDDLTAALGGTSKAFLIAFKVEGVDAGTFLNAFVQAAAQDPAGQLSDVSIGGKQAKRFTDSTGTTTYLYLQGDVVITVTPVVEDQAVLDEIFQKLG